MELDHVLIPLVDLSRAVTEFEGRYGLVSVEGGRHEDWGTANRIIPLGDSYLELVAVVDPAEASQSAFGRWVANAQAGRPLGWAVRTDDLGAAARRARSECWIGGAVHRDGGLNPLANRRG